MTDVLIPLGDGSLHDDNELRYCLRAIERHLKGCRDVYLVGRKPDWCTNVVHVPARDDDQKQTNIMRKVLRGCHQPKLSEFFLFMNDDHFLISDVDAATYPYYHKGPLQACIAHRKRSSGCKAGYTQTLENTLQLFGFRACNFDVHTPIVYCKTQFRLLAVRHNWNVPESLVVKSTYCNTLGIKGEHLRDCRINSPVTPAQLAARLEGRNVFSIGDGGYDSVLPYLEKHFPNKSRYEH